MLSPSRCAPSCVAEQVEDRLISLSLTLSHQQPSFALRSCYLKNTFTLICVYMWITPCPCIYVTALQPGEIYPPPLNRSHKGCCASRATPKKQFQSISSSPVLVICFLFSAAYFFPLSWLNVIHLKAVLMISTHAQNSRRSDTHKHTHTSRSHISYCLGWIRLSRTGVKSFNILPLPRGSCLCPLTPEQMSEIPVAAVH